MENKRHLNAHNGTTPALQKLVYAAMAVIMAFTLVQNGMFLLENHTLRLIAVVVITMVVLAYAAMLLYRQRCSDRALLAGVLVLGVVLRLGVILLVDTRPVSDFALLYNAAQSVNAGDFSWAETDYFRHWGYQIPFVLYQAAVLKVFPSILALKLGNFCFMTGTHLLIYAMARELSSPRAAAVTAFLYACYPAPLLLATVLTNQHSAAFFLYLGIYLALRLLRGKVRAGWLWAVGAGACLCVGNLMRPEGLVIVVSALMVLLLLALGLVRKQNTLKPILGLVAVLLCYFGLSLAAPLAFSSSPAAPYGISNTRPEWKFVLGLNPKSGGTYLLEDESILALEDPAMRRRATVERIKANFKVYDGNVLTFLNEKTKRMWAEGETSEWAFPDTDWNQPVYAERTAHTVMKVLLMADKGAYLLALSCALICAVRQLLSRCRADPLPFFSILFLVNYAVYLLIETQPRYRYFIMPTLFILGTRVGTRGRFFRLGAAHHR